MLKIPLKSLRREQLRLIEARWVISIRLRSNALIDELGLTYDRIAQPDLTIDISSLSTSIQFNLSSLPIKTDGLMTLRISSISDPALSYSFWAREAIEPSRIPILSLGESIQKFGVKLQSNEINRLYLAFCDDGVTQIPEQCDSELNCTASCNFNTEEPVGTNIRSAKNMIITAIFCSLYYQPSPKQRPQVRIQIFQAALQQEW